MPANNQEEVSPQPRPTFGQRARQAGLFLLFGTILFIPRIRRLRRRVMAWTCVRLAVAACGAWLLWRYVRSGAGAWSLAFAILLFAFSLLIRAKPVVKSVDALAGELGALIVLNGGIFQPHDATRAVRAQIAVRPEQLIVLGPGQRRILEIPMARVRNLEAHAVTNGTAKGAEPWEVEIHWLADAPCVTTFHYDGVFAEHLARVTESTLRGQWKRDLPILPQ